MSNTHITLNVVSSYHTAKFDNAAVRYIERVFMGNGKRLHRPAGSVRRAGGVTERTGIEVTYVDSRSPQ